MLFTVVMVSCQAAFAGTPYLKMALDYENKGDYENAVRYFKMEIASNTDKESLVYDLLGVARCYSAMNESDSVISYGNRAMVLACEVFQQNDKELESCLQSVAWDFFKTPYFSQALVPANKVLDLRKKIYGAESEEYYHWVDVIGYLAYESKRFDEMIDYCDKAFEIAEKYHGSNSNYFEQALKSIRTYSHGLKNECPQFVAQWVNYYYERIKDLDILPKYKYEFEILQLEALLAMNDLQSATKYAKCLERWVNPYREYPIPFGDAVTIIVKLANYEIQMGNYDIARIRLDFAWQLLSDNKAEPTMSQLIDRHTAEMQLTLFASAYSRESAEWIIETATPIINNKNESDATRAFFYESRAWAYEESNNFVKAIADIQQSIKLQPSDWRKHKLAGLYVFNKDYQLAEQLFLELYDDPNGSDVLKQNIEESLPMLYWHWGNSEKLNKSLSSEFENTKENIQNTFKFMNACERERYIMKIFYDGMIKYDIYINDRGDNRQNEIGNGYAYNLALMQKGLLLNTTREIKSILKNVPDSLKEKATIYNMVNDMYDMENLDIEDPDVRKIRLELMEYVSNQPEFLRQLNHTWSNVRSALQEGEVAIEFISLWGVIPGKSNKAKPGLGALLLKKDSRYPIFVKLAANAAIDSLWNIDDNGDRIREEVYLEDVRQTAYNKIWAPLEPWLKGVKNIYYSPAGYLQNINLDWIGGGDCNYLSEKYKLYRLSSTHELCDRKSKTLSNDAMLYGDITYSIKGAQVSNTPESKYRSTSRAGFGPLSATSKELDSITNELHLHSILSKDFRKTMATEESFRNLSGKSPGIIHVATHGFCYSPEALRECDYGSFMWSQKRHPELYHSGIALSGAQDTWRNDSKDPSKYFDVDSLKKDGILLSSEISKMDLSNTDLVVLSACQTAQGYIKIDGVYGLQRAFKLAGVNSLIMSLWKVDDDATQILMTSFYQNYLNGMSKREALLTAQNKVRNTPGFEDPYNWAAFILLDGLN